MWSCGGGGVSLALNSGSVRPQAFTIFFFMERKFKDWCTVNIFTMKWGENCLIQMIIYAKLRRNSYGEIWSVNFSSNFLLLCKKESVWAEKNIIWLFKVHFGPNDGIQSGDELEQTCCFFPQLNTVFWTELQCQHHRCWWHRCHCCRRCSRRRRRRRYCRRRRSHHHRRCWWRPLSKYHNNNFPAAINCSVSCWA